VILISTPARRRGVAVVQLCRYSLYIAFDRCVNAKARESTHDSPHYRCIFCALE